jgi:hypothetical protein
MDKQTHKSWENQDTIHEPQTYSRREISMLQLQWNVSITKSGRWRNYIHYSEISLHWNTLKMSYRCLHRRFSHAAVIESNKSRESMRMFTLVDRSRMAIEQLAKSKAENVYIVTCHFDSIQQKLRRTSWWMWLRTINFYFLNHLQSLWSSFLLLFFAMLLIFTHFYN